MAKLLKLRRGTTTQHGSFTGAEGEVTIDTTKDTAVVHDGSQAGGRPLAREDMSNVSSASIAGRLGTDSIATTKIAGGSLPNDVTIGNNNIRNTSIVDAHVNASAAIAGSKITPSFTANMDVDGSITCDDIITAGALLHEGDTNTLVHFDANDQISLKTNGSTRLQVTNAGAAVTGTITSTGDITINEENPALNLVDVGESPDYQVRVDAGKFFINDTTNNAARLTVQTDGHIDIPGRIDATGGVAVSGNISCTGTVDGRDVAADGSKLDGIESGATADQSASEILTLIKTVDGSGSGLDADTLDGIDQGNFLRSNTADTAAGDITFSGGAGAVTIAANSDIRLNDGTWTGNATCKIQHHSNNLYLQYPDNGSFRVRDSGGNDNFTVDTSGNATAVGNVTAYSDARLKTDISTINDALGICGKLRGVSYKWLKDGSAGIGVIAQEVEEVIPEVVLTNVNTDPATGEETEVKSVDYGKIVGVLINAINELKKEVEELKNAKITG